MAEEITLSQDQEKDLDKAWDSMVRKKNIKSPRRNTNPAPGDVDEKMKNRI